MAALAERQHGVVAFQQLLAVGVDRNGIQRRIAAGRLYPRHRGVYSVGHRRLSARGRWMAAVLACGPRALLSHGSAAALWGILLMSGFAVDVTTSHRTRHNRTGIAVHRPRRLHREDRAVEDDIPVTSVARTLLDLAAVVQARQLRRAVDTAEHHRVLDLQAVERLIRRSRGHRGVGRLTRTLEDYIGPPPITRSELELRFLALCHEAGLPRAQVNVQLGGHEVDVLWAEHRLVVELDGHAHHHTRAAFEKDRTRDAELQAAGHRVLRITHRRLVEEPREVVNLIRSLLLSP